MINSLIQRDLNHVWHPASQMKDFEQCPPLLIHDAEGSYLHTDRGPLIDAISSWWCKSLGHKHPSIVKAIENQLRRFEHTIGANTTFPQLVELSETLAQLSGKQHVFFASDGACAVEISMKLALQAQQIKGQSHRNQFISLKNSYHGETLGALSVSDLGLYKKPFNVLELQCHFLENIPYVSDITDPVWQNCEEHWPQTLHQLNAVKDKVCALLVEPIVQGAGGMRCYSADFLKRLAQWCKEQDIYLIADEIMTGLGRTGHWLACQHANVDASMICLSKGLTSGAIPLSAVLIDHSIYSLFYDDFAKGKTFMHSHTYSNHALAVSAALAAVRTMQSLNIPQQAEHLGEKMRQYFTEITNQTGKLSHVRSVGAWVAADLVAYKPRMGFLLYQEALTQGALIRPMGNTLYWLPPLTTDEQTIGKLAEITLNSIEAVYK